MRTAAEKYYRAAPTAGEKHGAAALFFSVAECVSLTRIDVESCAGLDGALACLVCHHSVALEYLQIGCGKVGRAVGMADTGFTNGSRGGGLIVVCISGRKIPRLVWKIGRSGLHLLIIALAQSQ